MPLYINGYKSFNSAIIWESNMNQWALSAVWTEEHATCSLTEARMLLAVLSASMLRPVELSRMVSRSPSSVTGLCSGAGIPPVWTNPHTHTHTHTHNVIWSAQAPFLYTHLVHTYETVCKRVQTHSTHKCTLESTTPRYTQASDAEKWLSMVTRRRRRHHQQYTNTLPHMPYGPKRKRLSMFHVGDSANQCHMALRQHTS